MNYFNMIPLEIMYEITSYLSLADLGRLQQTSTKFYNLLLTDTFYVYYNTVKFFELYYRKRLFAIFLFPHVHPRYTYLPNGPRDDSDCFTGNTIFHIAASNGVAEAVRFFMQSRNTFMLLDDQTLFNIEAKSLILLRDCNKHCAMVDLVNEEPNTPLHYISVIPDGVDERAVLNTAKYMIREGGAKIERKGRAGNNVLAEAAQHGQLGMVKLLLEEYKRHHTDEEVKALISEQNEYEENSIILSARGHPEVLRLLLQNGGNPNSTRRGYALLHIVCSRFNLDRYDPASLHQYHSQMTSPISWGSPVQRYTDVSNRHEDGSRGEHSMWPSLHSNRKHDEILKLLIEFGADLSIVEASTGMKPMHTAAFWGDQSAIEILKQWGVDPNQELNMRNGWLPVHYACSEGQIFAVQTLIECNARVWDSDEVDFSLAIDEATGLLLPPVPKYPFNIDISGLPEGLHVPAPLELMSFDAMKMKIQSFSRQRMKEEDVGR